MKIKDLGNGLYLDDCVLYSNSCTTSPPLQGQKLPRKPIVLAIVGKSASGKDYFAKMLTREIFYITPIVSWTTRPPREGEKEGIDYHFASEEEFLAAKQKGEFLEWSSFNGWYYGTPHSAIETDDVYVGVFNLDGLSSLMLHQDMYDVLPIYMDAPWPVRLKRSIKREGKFSKEMVRRMLADHQDFAHDKYNLIKKLGRNKSLHFDNEMVEQLPDLVILNVQVYIYFLLVRGKFNN